MYLQRLYIGMNDKDKHEQMLSREDFIKMIKACLLGYGLEAFTIIDSVGIYRTEQENTLIVEVIKQDKNSLISTGLIKLLKELLNQECIMHTIQEIEANFI